MYRCMITNRLSRLGEPLHRVVLAVRKKDYFKWIKNEDTFEWEQVKVASGTEIVAEVNANADGEATWNSWEPDARWLFVKTYYPHLIKMVENSKGEVSLC